MSRTSALTTANGTPYTGRMNKSLVAELRRLIRDSGVSINEISKRTAAAGEPIGVMTVSDFLSGKTKQFTLDRAAAVATAIGLRLAFLPADAALSAAKPAKAKAKKKTAKQPG